jgi:NhaP-type Na+/H+ or K+/H+ antiporter
MIFIIITLLLGALLKYKFPNKASFLLFLIGASLHYTNKFQWWENIESHTILLYMIPPLIYFSTAHVDFHILKQFLKQLIILNIPVLLLTIGTIAWIISFLEDFNFKTLLLISTIISATDPVTIVNIFKNLNMSKKIKTLVDGEALLNDGVVYLIYSLLLSTDNTTNFILKIVYLPIGSIFFGTIFFFIFFNILRNVYDSDIEITLSFVSCYGCFYMAQEYFHISGILTIVIFGLWMAFIGKTSFSPSIKKSIEHVWETMEINMNHIILSLSGLIGMKSINYFYTHWYKLIILFILINIVRIISILIFSSLLIHKKYRIFKKQLFLVGLSNIKGAITIVLTLELIEKEYSDLILFYVYGLVFLSLLINPIIVSYFIQNGIKHEYDETVEYILLIRNKLEKVGYNIKICLMNKSNYLKNIKWETVEKNMIQPMNISRSRIDHNQIAIDIEYRVIYLMSLKESFWRLFNDNQLYRDSLVYLLDLVDDILDSNDKHWESCFNSHCSLPKYYNWVPSWYRRKVLYHKINHKHNILSGFVMGQKNTLENLNTIFEMDCNIIQDLKIEMEKSIFKAKEILSIIEEEYPEITQKIETRQAVYFVLKNQQRFLKRIFKEGKINYYIYNHINQEINQKLH